MPPLQENSKGFKSREYEGLFYDFLFIPSIDAAKHSIIRHISYANPYTSIYSTQFASLEKDSPRYRNLRSNKNKHLNSYK